MSCCAPNALQRPRTRDRVFSFEKGAKKTKLKMRKIAFFAFVLCSVAAIDPVPVETMGVDAVVARLLLDSLDG